MKRSFVGGGKCRYRNELEAVGVDTVGKFKRIIHSAQSLECNERKKKWLVES